MKLTRNIMNLWIAYKYRNIQFKKLGKNCQYRWPTGRLVGADYIALADHVHIGSGCDIDGTGGLSIGRGTILAPEVMILSRTHNFNDELKALPFDDRYLTAPVTIGQYVWIGARAIILPGVTIGDGAVIGAGTVVHQDVAAASIVAGNPARVVGTRDVATFKRLINEEEPFVYARFGHAKKAMKHPRKYGINAGQGNED